MSTPTIKCAKRLLNRLAAWRLRLLFRGAFMLLMVGVLAMLLAVLQEEKQRSTDNYQASFIKTAAQIVSRLYHPSGLLALMNPNWQGTQEGQPVVLPFSAIDFDDQSKVRNAIEMASCLLPYQNNASLCVAVGNNPWAGGFIYVAGTFASGPLEAHQIGHPILDGAHRLRVTVRLGSRQWRWIAPFEPLSSSEPTRQAEGVRGRFTGYEERAGRDYKNARTVKEFRGWVWQAGNCLDVHDKDNDNCRKSSFFSVRLPVDSLREALFARPRAQTEWPPANLNDYRVHVEVLPPGDGAALFDNQNPPATPPFSLSKLAEFLQPGERLRITRLGAPIEEVIQLVGRDDAGEQVSPWLTRLIRRLPVVDLETSHIHLREEITTPIATYQLEFSGDARSVNKALSVVATRLSWFVAAMLGAIMLAWLVIEIGLIRRIAQLSKRTQGLPTSEGLAHYAKFDFTDLRGADELGLLACGLDDLLRRVKEDAEREHLRNEQEKDRWHAVGHEIMSPLQSLLVLHHQESDPSQRYLKRMQQAVRILYGSASPSEAFTHSDIDLERLDLAAFVREVTTSAGISALACSGAEKPLWVRADAYALEDVLSHLLNNAERHRFPNTPISLGLSCDEQHAQLDVHNYGAPISDTIITQIFDYGISALPDAARGNRGQGLFVAKTYMAKMGGKISVYNQTDGVVFRLYLQRLADED